MKENETLRDFYQRVPQVAQGLPIENLGAGHVNIFSREKCNRISPYMRRDFYKVALIIIGQGNLQYAHRRIVIDRPALIFSNPMVPYAWDAISEEQKGWFVLFSDSFLLNGTQATPIKESPLFKVGGDPVFFLEEDQLLEISDIFKKMEREMESDYRFKYDVIRNHLQLVIHTAMKYHPANNFEKQHNTSERVANLFLELLERQFPAGYPGAPLQMRSARDYAEQLSVHVNHLNRSVKRHTHKTTTEHIADRVVQEAIALLQHSDFSISEIAHGLGFDSPAYFTNFFKRKTGKSPNQVRKVSV